MVAAAREGQGLGTVRTTETTRRVGKSWAGGGAWDEDRATRICVRVAQRQIPLFAAFREYELEDLVSEALTAVRAAHSSFDPAKAAYSTFVYRVAHNTLIDLYRRRKRRGLWEAMAAFDARADAQQQRRELREYDDGGSAEPDIPEWCAMKLRGLQHTFERRTRLVGRRYYRIPQLAVVVLLLVKKQEECEGYGPEHLREMFANRPDVRAALGFCNVPGSAFFQRVDRLRQRGQAMMAGES